MKARARLALGRRRRDRAHPADMMAPCHNRVGRALVDAVRRADRAGLFVLAYAGVAIAVVLCFAAPLLKAWVR